VSWLKLVWESVECLGGKLSGLSASERLLVRVGLILSRHWFCYSQLPYANYLVLRMKSQSSKLLLRLVYYGTPSLPQVYRKSRNRLVISPILLEIQSIIPTLRGLWPSLHKRTPFLLEVRPLRLLRGPNSFF
jgi:hypothetical protein